MSEAQENAGVGHNISAALIDAVDRQIALEKEIEDLNKQLEEKKRTLLDISEKEIPELFGDLDGKLTLPNGRTVEVIDKIRASISKENQPAAFEYLNETGKSALIKRKFEIQFSRDQEALAEIFRKQVEALNLPVNITQSNSVHPSTLLSFVKESLADGKQIPMDVFGVYRQRIAKVGIKSK